MRPVDVTLVCPVGRHTRELSRVHREFRDALAETGRSAEFIYVIDGPWTGAEPALQELGDSTFAIRVFRMARGFGESTALQFGFERARGRFVLTIPDRPQIDPRVLIEVLHRLESGCPVIVTRREPRTDALLNRLQSRVFHALVRRLAGREFQDLSCGVRGFTADAARKLDLYGDQHRFIPVIAGQRGYPVVEIPGRQHPANVGLRLRTPGVYVRRLLDILNIYFLTRFTRKPLRFFGLIGMAVGTVGLAISGYLAVLRLLGLSGLTDRPLLLLGVLMIVLGVQVTSIGLLGEIIIFLSSRRDEPEASELRADEPGSAAARAEGDARS